MPEYPLPGVISRGIDQVRYWTLRASERYNDFALGIYTDALINTDALGIHNPDSREYGAVPYRVLKEIFRSLTIHPSSVFLDIGCGMGRPMVMALRSGFQRVIGVDISPELCAIARKNVKQVERNGGGHQIEIVQADATRYSVPTNVSTVFLANPFRGETLEAVVRNLQQSFFANPRAMQIVCFNTALLETGAQENDWIRETAYARCFPRTSWKLYETKHQGRTGK